MSYEDEPIPIKVTIQTETTTPYGESPIISKGTTPMTDGYWYHDIGPKYETLNKVPLYSVWFNDDILIADVPFKDAIDVYLNLKRIGEESKKPYTRKMEVTSYIYTAAEGER